MIADHTRVVKLALFLSRLTGIAVGSVRLWWHFCAILYIFPAWSHQDTVKAVLWSVTEVSILQDSEPQVAFLQERWEEVLESAKEAERGLLEEESGREPSWAQ